MFFKQTLFDVKNTTMCSLITDTIYLIYKFILYIIYCPLEATTSTFGVNILFAR